LLVDQDDIENRIAELEPHLSERGEQSPGTVDAGAPAPREAIRCLLFEYGLGWMKGMLAIDIGRDAVWVWERARQLTTYRTPSFDSAKSTLVASVGRAQVSATPAAYTADSKRGYGNTQPVLILSIPGFPPLTIGCGERAGTRWNWMSSNLRFWWRGKVPWVKPPAYFVAAKDWLTLVEAFGLAPYLDDKSSPQLGGGGRELAVSPRDVKTASKAGRERRTVSAWFFTIVLAVLAFVMFFVGARNFDHYRAGTPTTATVTHCSTPSDCRGTWSIGGVSQTGPIAVEFSTPSVGSSVDVRVRDGKATAPSFWPGGFAVGGVLLACSILVFVLSRSRTGTLVGR
jgi:hypothetical protein